MLNPIVVGQVASTEVRVLLDTILNAEKALKYLDEIQKAEASMLEERNKLTKAKDLDKAIAKTRETQEKLDRAMSDALDHAAKVKNEANVEAKRLLSEAQIESTRLKDEAVNLKMQAERDWDAIDKLKQQANQAKERMEAERDEVREQKQVVATLQVELSEKLAKLKAITG